MPKLNLSEEELKIIKKMRYDDTKMLEGWNAAIDGVLLLLENSWQGNLFQMGVDKVSFDSLTGNIAEMKK